MFRKFYVFLTINKNGTFTTRSFNSNYKNGRYFQYPFMVFNSLCTYAIGYCSRTAYIRKVVGSE